jgi:hypothetical protein
MAVWKRFVEVELGRLALASGVKVTGENLPAPTNNSIKAIDPRFGRGTAETGGLIYGRGPLQVARHYLG